MIAISVIYKLMADAINLFHSFIPSYGWAIIFLTFALRLVLFPLSIGQIRYMEKMKVIQPRLKEIQDKYRDKPEEMNRRTMEFYKQNNMNPLGGCLQGCLPLLVQYPFLIAIYGVLQKPEAHNLAGMVGQHFAAIDLLAKGSFTNLGGSIGNLVLALISGGTTYLQSKLMNVNPPAASTSGAADPTASMQKMFLYIMPLMLAYFTFVMPAAVGIYWVAQNIFMIVQQIVVVRFFVPRAKPVA